MSETARILAALRQRLRAAAEVLLLETTTGYDDPGQDVAMLIEELVARARSTLRRDEAWLLWIGGDRVPATGR